MVSKITQFLAEESGHEVGRERERERLHSEAEASNKTEEI
jgi:hypothetical protein